MGRVNMGWKCSGGRSRASARSLSRRMPSAVTALKYVSVTILYWGSASCRKHADLCKVPLTET